MLLLSTDSLNKDFDTKEYKNWSKKLELQHSVHHNKFWEQAMIYEALKHYGLLKKGNVGLGFGVGREQLVSVFANEGATIVATDQAPDEKALAWDNGQLANGKKSLYYPKLISKNKFENNVAFQHHDMNKFEKSFVNKFDFSWSNCVVGHLGSMKQSEEFLKRHSKYLKYGGISVVTTELNISSLAKTVTNNSGTIIWRLSDLLRVFTEMLDEDMVAERLRLRLVGDASDRYIYFDIADNIPSTFLKDKRYRGLFMTKIPFSNYVITQVQIIFKKRALNRIQKAYYRNVYKLDYRKNLEKLKKFINSDGDISDYSTKYTKTDLPIIPSVNSKTITIKAGEAKKVNVTFTNNSDEKFFAYGLHTPLDIAPLVLATMNPVNRKSKFATKNWFHSNRPAVEFKPSFDKAKYTHRCHGAHRSLPGEQLTYTIELKAPVKKGKYAEDFILVLEGVGDIPKSVFSLIINVV